VAYRKEIPLIAGGTYSIVDWRDALRVLYFGVHHDGTKDCNSIVRRTLANRWGDFFENSSCNGAGDFPSGGPCKQIWHLFRMGNASGGGTTFSSLLSTEDVPVVTPVAVGGLQAAATSTIAAYRFGSDSYCNDTPNLVSASGAPTVPLQFPPDAPTTGSAHAAVQPGWTPGAEAGQYVHADLGVVAVGYTPNDETDRDPIRRRCQSGPGGKGEDVCQHATVDPSVASCTTDADCEHGLVPHTSCQGGTCWTKPGFSTNGFLLPITTANASGTKPTHQFNDCASECTSEALLDVPVGASDGPDGVRGIVCPNGDLSSHWGYRCWVPVDSTGSPNCISRESSTPRHRSITSQGDYLTQTASGQGPDPATTDGRAYNAWVWVDEPYGSNTNWRLATDPSGRPFTGAYYRLHECSSNTFGHHNVACQNVDATSQIGCLVQASPCSIGFTSRSVVQASRGTVALQVNGVPDRAECITGNGGDIPYATYPFARKLFLNTLAGFDVQSDLESALTSCFDTPAIIDAALDAEGFIPVPTTSSCGGAPYCEDFNEQATCGAETNIDACASTLVAGLGNGRSVTCGNGIVECGEQCDSTAGCSIDCRMP
jgi:hypothetical protein